ncbi:MAG: alpha/beta fold hydrolase [Pseudolysinimonas sp.]
MPSRLSLIAAVALLLAGCGAPAPASTPTPTETGPRTLRTLIDAPTEAPVLEIGAEEQRDGFSVATASYASEGLTITGMLYLPDGDGPFPGVVIVHGAVDPALFTTGSDLVREQETFALSGHVVFAPDLRGFGGSDPDPSGGTDLEIGAVADLVNAGRALSASGIPSLDAGRIGVFGHSLGGGESLSAMVVAPEVYDVVAAMSPVSSRPWWVVDHFLPRDSLTFAAIAAVHGTYEDNQAHWDDLASATFAARAAVPLLVAYGTADDPVYATWEEHTVEDWQNAGADVTLLTVEGGDHRLDPHWDEAFGQMLSFMDQALLP